MDKDLTWTERELALTAIDLATMVDTAGDESYWTEELIPPMTEDDVLSSSLVTRPGAANPEAGFILWQGDRHYRVIIQATEP